MTTTVNKGTTDPAQKGSLVCEGKFLCIFQVRNSKPQILVDVLDHLEGDVGQDSQEICVIKKVLKEDVDVILDLLLECLQFERNLSD